ncbi:MAG: ABC transporter permease subunit [Chloroflexi bacterium]|nr:ABC transporter permease subunit [Chloroflexota bacterium]
MWWGLFAGAVVWALNLAGAFSEEIFNPGGFAQLQAFFVAALHPQRDLEFLGIALHATLVTLAYAVGGAALSLLLGFVGGVFTSEVWWEAIWPYGARFGGHRGPWLIMRAGLAIPRGVHEIVWGLIFINIIGLDPLSAILAIAIPFGAITAKVFSEILDETPREPFLALRNGGAPTSHAFLYTLLPQASRDLIAYGFYRLDCAVRAATVLGIIGAGGLGFQIFVSLKTLKFEQIWTFLYALFLLNGAFDLWSGMVRRRLGSSMTCSVRCHASKPDWRLVNNAPSPRKDLALRGSMIALALLIPFSFWYVAPDVSKLFSPRTFEQLRYMVALAFPPDFGAQSLTHWLELAGITVGMSVLALAFAGLWGLLLSFPAARNFLLPGGLAAGARGNGGWAHRVGALVAFSFTRFFLLTARSIPPPIWALLLLFVMFPGILPGALALGLYTVGVLGRLMAEVIENLDERPVFALKVGGASKSQAFLYGVLPAAAPRFLAYLLYRWEEIMRATVMIGLVGAGGLGRLLVEQLIAFDGQAALATLIIFGLLSLAVDMLSSMARRDFRDGR